MEYESIKKIYKNYALFYDFLFKRFFHPRQQVAFSELDFTPGQKILDVGVGTGLSLPLYPDCCDVVGIDLSIDMLKQAEKKKKKLGLDHVSLMEMDACHMAFPDSSFDIVVATHIISVVPDPFKVLEEMARVAKPDAKIVIVNHFVSSHPVLGKVEKKCDPFLRWLGFRMDMSLEDLTATGSLEVEKINRVNKIGWWKIVHAQNNKPESAPTP